MLLCDGTSYTRFLNCIEKEWQIVIIGKCYNLDIS